MKKKIKKLNKSAFNKKVFRFHINKIGRDGFILFFYYKMFNEKKIFEFRRTKIASDIGMSKKTLQRYNEILMQNNIINFERTKIGGEEILKISIKKNIVFEEDERLTVSYTYTNTNSSNSSSKDKNKLSITTDSNIYKYYKTVKRSLLSHPRFNHSVYTSRFERIEVKGISNKELNNIKRLTKKIKLNDLEKYTKWWIKNKIKNITGFSFGIFAYEETLDEFLVKIKKVDPYAKETKKEVKKKNAKSTRNGRIRNLKKRISKMNLDDIQDYEWDFLRKAEEFELVKIKGKKVKILFED